MYPDTRYYPVLSAFESRFRRGRRVDLLLSLATEVSNQQIERAAAHGQRAGRRGRDMAELAATERLLRQSREVGARTLRNWAPMMLGGRALFDFAEAYEGPSQPGGQAGGAVRVGGSLSEALDRLAEPFVEAHYRQVRGGGGATTRSDRLLQRSGASVGYFFVRQVVEPPGGSVPLLLVSQSIPINSPIIFPINSPTNPPTNPN
eukprot:SAG31_NODE_6787_length_1888_cov_1.680268_2_plen_204_part_00